MARGITPHVRGREEKKERERTHAARYMPTAVMRVYSFLKVAEL